MSYNGSGTFQINTSGQPVVAGTVISSTAFNALTADLATGLSTAITKDGQTTTTARIPFAAGINSSSATDSTNTSTGSIITSGGVGIAKALYVGTTANVASTTDSSSISTGSIVTAGGVGVAKNLYVGVNANIAGTLGVTGVATFSAAPIYSSLTASSAVATDASKTLVSVTNTGTGNNVLATSPTLVTPVLGAASATSLTVAAGAVGTPSITTTGDTNTGIFFPAADTIAFSEGGVEAARFDSSGQLGIGTVSPASKLEVSSSASNAIRSRSTSNNPIFELFADGYATAQFNIDRSTGVQLLGTGAIPMVFSTNSAERARITSGGELLVGTTSLVDQGKISISFNAGANQGITLNDTSSTSGGNQLRFKSGGTFVGAITTTTSATTYTTSSDYRLKENVHPIPNALDRVLSLKPVIYSWKNTDGELGEGFIAHELQEILPYAVSGEKDGEQMQGVDYSKLTPILTAALQEAIAEIQSLKTRVAKLEAK